MDSKKRAPSDDHVENVLELPSKQGTGEQLANLSGIESEAASSAAWMISITVSMGSFLFGYDTGYISSVLVTIGADLGHRLQSSEEELVTSLTSGGALVGAIAAGLAADKYGRKWPIWFACATFIIGTILQTAAYGVPQFAAGRFVVGVGVGLAAMVVPLYIGELAPARYRGRMIAFSNVSVTFGQFVASGIGAGLAQVRGPGWRGTVGIGAIPAIMLAVMLAFCPESPRQLVAHGQHDQAAAVLVRIYPTSSQEQRDDKIRSIELSIAEATTNIQAEPIWVTFWRIFRTPSTGRAVAVACITMAISQLGGFNTLMYYSAKLFAIVGFNNATAVAIVVSGTNFFFSILNLLLVDRFGRRILVTTSVAGMSTCMAIAAVSFHYIPINLSTLEVESNDIGWPATLMLVTIIVYVAFYSSGVATIAWIGVELIPMEARALGTMLNTVTCWSTNIIIASTFLTMMKGITPSGAFGFYAGTCAIGWVFLYFCYPHVKGMPLEAIRDVFQDGFGVRQSKQWQRDSKFITRTEQQTYAQ